MLEDCRAAKERWGGVSGKIDHWLNGRQDLIVLYCSVNGVGQLSNDNRPLAIKLKELCQILIDYVSSGHFGVYEYLNKGNGEVGCNNEYLDIVQLLYPQIESNTHLCLDFNDSCEIISNIRSLQNALSSLGEALEDRFVLEDHLIEILHEGYRQ